MDRLSHIDEQGNVHMVDVSAKEVSVREAVAGGTIRMKAETLKLIQDHGLPKGDVFAAARIAGILAAKQTDSLIPLCHSLPLESVSVELTPDEAASCVHIQACARCSYKTGVEMEALTAVSVAALTIYDMCKAVDRGMEIDQICLLRKSGGKSGLYERKSI